jgi:hypothetical protein
MKCEDVGWFKLAQHRDLGLDHVGTVTNRKFLREASFLLNF